LAVWKGLVKEYPEPAVTFPVKIREPDKGDRGK